MGISMSDHTPTIWLDVLAIVMGMIAVAFTSWLAILACGGCLLAADQIERRGLTGRIRIGSTPLRTSNSRMTIALLVRRIVGQTGGRGGSSSILRPGKPDMRCCGPVKPARYLGRTSGGDVLCENQ